MAVSGSGRVGESDNICQFEVFISFRIEVDGRGLASILSGHTNTSYIRNAVIETPRSVETPDTNAGLVLRWEALGILYYTTRIPVDLRNTASETEIQFR